jgi:hypothetical protein
MIQMQVHYFLASKLMIKSYDCPASRTPRYRLSLAGQYRQQALPDPDEARYAQDTLAIA